MVFKEPFLQLTFSRAVLSRIPLRARGGEEGLCAEQVSEEAPQEPLMKVPQRLEEAHMQSIPSERN